MVPGISAYRQVTNETASRERTLVLLFEAAHRFMQGGAANLERGAAGQAIEQLSKASEIVLELMRTLDKSKAPELCATLEAVYEFVAIELARAVASRKPGHARNAERAFVPLVDAFRQAAAQVG